MSSTKRNIQSSPCSTLILGLGAVLLTSTASAQTFYKWVDSQGATHYTQSPPPGKNAKNTKKVFVNDAVPPTLVNQENSAGGAVPNGNSSGNSTSNLNSGQLADAATAGSVPDRQSVQRGQSTAANPAVAAPLPQIAPVTPPPANRLINPSQEQIRPAFSEQ